MTMFIALSGFLGAGKTTTMTAAARRLREAGRRVAVVTNDQGAGLVDTAMAGLDVDDVGEVTGGCFCCRFEDLLTVTTRLVGRAGADVVIAESVGSCTDLTATVVRPMVALYGQAFTVAPMTTVVDPLRFLRMRPLLDAAGAASDLAYLFGKQLEDAAVIGVNKADLLDPDELAEIMEAISRRCPQAQVVGYSAARGEVDPLLRAWDRPHDADTTDLDVDYHRYGAAEAGLAWLNRTFAVGSPAGFAPGDWARAFLTVIADHCRRADAVVGHVKVIVDDGSTVLLAKASLIDGDRPPGVDLATPDRIRTGRAVVNARVECEPGELETWVAAAVGEADRAVGARSDPADANRSFKPGQPKPTHRILVSTATTMGGE